MGSGVDIVDVKRFGQLIDKHGERFLFRWFDPAEIEYCTAKIHPCQHFAARFAAKEAVFKALSLSKHLPLCWKQIVVLNKPDGNPTLELLGPVYEAMQKKGIATLHLSLSHCDTYAIAMVTAEG
jgi:holo-[acyl-carrier protein] synthase